MGTTGKEGNHTFLKCIDAPAAPSPPLPPCPGEMPDHRGLLRVTKMRTRRIAMRRSLNDVMARMVSWALLSSGRTASSHQHQAGPLGLACRDTGFICEGKSCFMNMETESSQQGGRGCFVPTVSPTTERGISNELLFKTCPRKRQFCFFKWLKTA